jgi:tetratricopeptide (TPR) repeat protein
VKTKRNEACPCGSGKKYKHCCLDKDAAASAAAAVARHPTAAASDSSLLRLPDVPEEIAEELDAASNLVVDLIQARKLDEAEKAAHALLARFPQVHDGYDRLGMVSEARGDLKQAAAYYRKVVDFVEHHPDGYQPGFADLFRQQADRLDPPPSAG